MERENQDARRIWGRNRREGRVRERRKKGEEMIERSRQGVASDRKKRREGEGR